MKNTHKISADEVEALKNVFKALRGEKVDEDHINYDVVKFEAVLRRANVHNKNDKNR